MGTLRMMQSHIGYESNDSNQKHEDKEESKLL